MGRHPPGVSGRYGSQNLPRERVTLKNREGRMLTLTLRGFREGDEEGLIACIRDEYGETYFKRSLYHPDSIRSEAERGRITFLTAQTDEGEIAGMMILKEFYPQESMCEIASQIFRKEYRGYGLAMPFFEYGMRILLSRSYSAAYCLPVVFHDTTQRLLHRLGLRATGFVLNVFDMETVRHSYPGDRNGKHSQGIQIRAVDRRFAGDVYLPERHRAFAGRVYDSLGVSCRMAKGEERTGKALPQCCGIRTVRDRAQSSLETCICSVGADLPRRMEALHEKYPLRGKQTANVFLSCSDRYAPWAYRILEEMGYFFTGLKPLCGEREYMVLHHPGEVEIYPEDYAVSGEFADLLDYVKGEYGARKGEESEKKEKHQA